MKKLASRKKLILLLCGIIAALYGGGYIVGKPVDLYQFAPLAAALGFVVERNRFNRKIEKDFDATLRKWGEGQFLTAIGAAAFVIVSIVIYFTTGRYPVEITGETLPIIIGAISLFAGGARKKEIKNNSDIPMPVMERDRGPFGGDGQ
ncbi:MAG: hypothetical protein GY757_08765 [bacterium]|nr:hypothetical protein [bacterium]